jgi:hypothetical protein
MRTKNPTNSGPIRQSLAVGGARRILFCSTLTGLLLASVAAQAANILANPGFETSPALTGWSVHTTETWSINGANTQGKLYHTGANGLWTQGLYGNGGALPYYNMYAFQKIAAAPGATFTADAWFSEYSSYYQHQGGDNGAGSGLLTTDGSGVEDCWVEVQFLDSANTILADYKSAIISPIDATLPGSAGVQTINVYNWPTITNVIAGVATNIYLDWIHCQVTNQFDVSTIGPNVDPATESVTNTLSTGVMVAPPGTAYVQYMLCLAQALYESGANYWDDCTLIQLGGPSASIIGGLTPDGSKFFNTNTSLSFTVTSAATGGASLPVNPTNGVKVVVNGVDKSSTLQFGGNPTNLSVTMPGLTSNAFYTISITVSNSAGLLTTANPTFDTLTPVYIVPVETFDYTNGLFIQNPVPTATADPNSYFGRAGVLGTDMSTYNGSGTLPGGASTLAPNYPNRTDLNEAFEVASDTQLPLYQNVPGVYTVDFSYNNPGNWFNYTRNPWPSGSYQVYARISGGQGTGTEYLNLLTSGYGTPNQTTNRLGQFYLANGVSWTTYYWVPLTDTDGNAIAINVPSGRQTLQLLSSPIAGENVISFVFVPLPTSGLPPTLNSINPPNGSSFVDASAGITFTATAGLGSAPINSSGIHLSLNGADVTSGLTIAGSGPINVSYLHLLPNTIYTAIIAVTNTAGVGVTRTLSFDTMSTDNFYVKVADFDYDSGLWDTNGNGIVAYAYQGLGGAVSGVDYSHDPASGQFGYRLPGLATEVTADNPLPGYVAGNDWDVGFFNTGDWGNYTRNYPAGKYVAYGRLAGGNGPLTAYLDQVTSGGGTTNQTTRRLGTWRANTGGWQNWAWVPLTDSGLTAPVIVTLGGTNTLRVTSGGNVNANYFMLVPAEGLKLTATRSGANIVISFPTQAGLSYRLFSKTTLSGGTWSLLTTVAGDGSVKSVSDPTTGAQKYYKLTSP